MKTSINSIKDYEKQNIPATIYVHSWELTPELIPRINLPMKENFVTFHNIKKTYSRIETLLQKFHFSSFENYIKNIK